MNMSLQDAIALSALTEEEIKAIAEHEQIPDMAAAEMGAYLVETATGERRISAMIREDIEAARARGDTAAAAKLKLVLKRFVDTHGAPAKQGAQKPPD